MSVVVDFATAAARIRGGDNIDRIGTPPDDSAAVMVRAERLQEEARDRESEALFVLQLSTAKLQQISSELDQSGGDAERLYAQLVGISEMLCATSGKFPKT
jgi:hypothetical protein